MLLALLRDVGGDELDPRVATYALFGMMNWIYTWYDPGGPISPSTLAEQLAAVFLHGVTSTSPTVSHGG